MSTTTDLLLARLLEVAAGPAEAETDGTRVSQHSLPDLIEALRAIGTAESVLVAGRRPVGITRLVPPGSTGNC